MVTIPYVSFVMCHVSRVTCHLSHVNLFLLLLFKQLNLLIGGASRWRVCYQRGLPSLVFGLKVILNPKKHFNYVLPNLPNWSLGRQTYCQNPYFGNNCPFKGVKIKCFIYYLCGPFVKPVPLPAFLKKM